MYAHISGFDGLYRKFKEINNSYQSTPATFKMAGQASRADKWGEGSMNQ